MGETRKNILKEKTYAFALRIIKLQKFLIKEKQEYVLSKQILKCGTSIGALVREAEYGQSTADFISKLSIAIKEANETDYWLNLLRDSKYIDNKSFNSISNDCAEILKLLTSIIKTLKSKQ